MTSDPYDLWRLRPQYVIQGRRTSSIVGRGAAEEQMVTQTLDFPAVEPALKSKREHIFVLLDIK